MTLTWPALALIFSFFGAMIIHANHVFKIDGFTAVFLRGFILLGIALPTALFLGAPTEISFYLFAATAGLFITVADVILMNASAHHGGRLTALYIPIKIFLVFFLWSALHPSSLTAFPVWKIAIILTCFIATASALLNFRKCDASFSAIIAVLPISLLFTFADVFAKEAISTSSLVASALMFLTISGLVSSFLSGNWIAFKRKQSFKEIFTKSNITGSFVMGSLLMVGIPIMLMAFALAPNPAYVGGITSLSGVWLTIYYYFSHGDKASIPASITLILSALILTFVTA